MGFSAMFIVGRISSGLIAASTSSHPFASVKKLNRGVGQTGVQLLMNELIGNTVEGFVDCQMVIDINRRWKPCRNLKSDRRF